jgi:hypothetical protein
MELFRGRLSPERYEISAANLARFLKDKEDAEPLPIGLSGKILYRNLILS